MPARRFPNSSESGNCNGTATLRTRVERARKKTALPLRSGFPRSLPSVGLEPPSGRPQLPARRSRTAWRTGSTSSMEARRPFSTGPVLPIPAPVRPSPRRSTTSRRPERRRVPPDPSGARTGRFPNGTNPATTPFRERLQGCRHLHGGRHGRNRDKTCSPYCSTCAVERVAIGSREPPGSLECTHALCRRRRRLASGLEPPAAKQAIARN